MAFRPTAYHLHDLLFCDRGCDMKPYFDAYIGDLNNLQDDMSALYLAVTWNHALGVAALATMGDRVDCNYAGTSMRVPACQAAFDPRMLPVLIDAFPDVDLDTTLGWKGQTPLHCAALHGITNNVTLLLARRVDTTIRDTDGNTAEGDSNAFRYFVLSVKFAPNRKRGTAETYAFLSSLARILDEFMGNQPCCFGHPAA